MITSMAVSRETEQEKVWENLMLVVSSMTCFFAGKHFFKLTGGIVVILKIQVCVCVVMA